MKKYDKSGIIVDLSGQMVQIWLIKVIYDVNWYTNMLFDLFWGTWGGWLWWAKNLLKIIQNPSPKNSEKATLVPRILCLDILNEYISSYMIETDIKACFPICFGV